MTLAIDFDGTMTRDLPPDMPLILRDGCADAVRAMRSLGHTLILHSCRFGADGSEKAAREAELFLRREGLWTLFDRVWTEPGKPLADVYLDNRAQRLGDFGRSLDGSVSWGMVGFWWGDAIACPTPAWSGAGDSPRLMVWRRIGDVTVWLVDGRKVREEHPQNDARNAVDGPSGTLYPSAFQVYGNDARYAWIPPNEIWIDSYVSYEEIGFYALGQAIERYWMLEGKGYPEASEIAGRIVTRIRADPSELDCAIDTACGVCRMVEVDQ